MLLHWLIAGLIVGQFVLAKLAELAKVTKFSTNSHCWLITNPSA